MDLRRQRHSRISRELSSLSDEALLLFLKSGSALQAGVGGHSFSLDFNGQPLFVKMLPLCEEELRSENAMSTRNFMSLPLRCHYGLGAPSFGAWRELAAHQITTRAVLDGTCSHFPLLFHWRILPFHLNHDPEKHRQHLVNEAKVWKDVPAVMKRVEGLVQAQRALVLFVEFFPMNLLNWIRQEKKRGASETERAAGQVEKVMWQTNDWMQSQGFVHFDAHFENIVTNGSDFCFTDFGLALSQKFELDSEEKDFLNLHQDCDFAREAMGFVHAFLTQEGETRKWRQLLREFLSHSEAWDTPQTQALIRKHAPMAEALSDFAHELWQGKLETPYPREMLQHLKQRCSK